MKFHIMLLSVTVLLLCACTTSPENSNISEAARLKPIEGTYYGVNLDWSQDSVAAYNQRLGIAAAVYVNFFPFPFGKTDKGNIDAFIEQVAAQGGMAIMTLEPHSGLDKVTDSVADDFARRLTEYNERGVPVFVRFAHEMNGSWYPWSQQPTEYVRAFRTLAEAVHKRTTLSAMLWAPNYGGGYPFAGGHYEVSPENPGFHILDTNQDGQLDMKDDPYDPYYPGDDVVDWVGLSIYHWGNRHPWGDNVVPEADKFVAQITGTYNGLDGDHSSVTDFYDVYVRQHRKPMAIVETAALYNTEREGDAELDIKRAWWQQVFSSRVAVSFPGIKIINWFECRKFETEVGAIVDWTVTHETVILQAYLDDLPRSRFLFGDDIPIIFQESPQ